MIQLPVMMRRRPKIQSLLYSALGPGLALMALLAIAAYAMLGPTGNLRAPVVKVGKTLLVGFNEDQYREVLVG